MSQTTKRTLKKLTPASGLRTVASQRKVTKTKAMAATASKAPAKRAKATKVATKLVAKVKARDLQWGPFEWQMLGPGPIIGVDEVGRGCLAGPVFAAAVILPEDCDIQGITDSKLLTEARREALAKQIYDVAQVGIGIASVGEIDRLNILQASFLAMRRAVENLAAQGGHVIVDGDKKIPLLEGFQQTAVIKGDLRATPIGAASIVAKVARDEMMKKLGERYPVYGFERHKGYSSPVHVEAIRKFGPCVHHRSTFAGVRELWTELLDEERAMAPF